MTRWLGALAAVAAVALVAVAACEKDRSRSAPPEPVEKPPDPAPPDPSLREDAEGFIAPQVAGGFATRDEIIEITVEVLSDEHDVGQLERIVPELTDAALAAHKQREKTWTEPTDCDRLDAAFSDLDAAGVVARQNFSDCGTCGAGEIYDLMVKMKAAGAPVRGYAFYHEQDTEGAEGGSLFLSYGSIEEGEKPAVAIGHEIVAALEKHGLKTSWNGELSRRIMVLVDWRRRRFTTAP